MRQQLMMMAFSLAVPLLATAPCWGGTIVFGDTTFDLADYSQASFSDDPAVTISTAQTLNGGNPGAALEIIGDVPPLNAFASMQGFVNPSFVYNPATQGVLSTIDASTDKEFNTDLNLASNSFRPLVLQGGNYYTASITLPATKNVWLTGSQVGLAASDFMLFNFTTGVFDATQHPDFTGGVMEFGIANRLTQTSNALPDHDDILYDNFRLQLNTVPEPASLIMCVAGASCVLVFVGRRKASPKCA